MLKAKIDDKSQNILVNVKCTKEEWQEAQNKARSEISKTLKVPGFRVGSKIPDHILDKHLDRSKIFNRAIEKMMKKYSKEAAKAVEKTKKHVFTQSTVDLLKLSDTELEFNYNFPFLPETKNLKLDGIDVKYKPKKFTSKLVDEEIDAFLIKLSVLEETKEAAKKTDHVVIDFKGFIDDEPFEGGEAEKYELVLGSNQFIPGFEDQLIGKKAGWKGSIEVVFPESYFVKEYRNKKCIFEIVIHEVKRHNIPKLDVTMLPMFGFPNITTVEELKEKMSLMTKQKLHNEGKVEFLNSIISQIVERNEIFVNDKLLESKVKELDAKFTDQLKQNDIKKSEYYELTKTTEQDTIEQFKETARKELINQLVYSQLVQRNNYMPTEKDIQDHYLLISKEYDYSIEDIKKFTKKDDIKIKLQDEKLIVDLIKEFDKEGYKQFETKEAELQKLIIANSKKTQKKLKEKQEENNAIISNAGDTLIKWEETQKISEEEQKPKQTKSEKPQKKVEKSETPKRKPSSQKPKSTIPQKKKANK